MLKLIFFSCYCYSLQLLFLDSTIDSNKKVKIIFKMFFFLRFLKQKKFKFLRMAETSKNFIQMYIIRSGDFQLNEWIKMQSSSFAVVCFWIQLYHLVCLFICCLSCEENSYAKQLTRLRFQLNADNFLKSSYIHKKNKTSLFFNCVKFTAKDLLCSETSCSFVFLRFKSSRR